jgi:hypothetical protein
VCGSVSSEVGEVVAPHAGRRAERIVQVASASERRVRNSDRWRTGCGPHSLQCKLPPNKRLRAWTGCQLLTIESMYTTSVFQNMCCLRGGSRGSRESPADPDVASSCLLLEALPMVVWLPMAQVLRGFQYTTQDVVRRESFKLFYIYSFCFF